MLIERGRRFLSLDFGNPDSEKDWQLTGWGKPVGTGLGRYCALGPKPGSVKYLGVFYPHFNYGWLVFRLAEPRPIDVLKLWVDATPIPISAELRNAGAKHIWQIPFPDGLISSTKVWQLQVEAPGWQVTDMALVGDRIGQRDLRGVKA